MNEKLSKEINGYISKNRMNFQNCISQMDLFNNDGSINTESVSEVVQKDILLIKNNLDNSEYQELTAQIRSAYIDARYDEILTFIFILSITAQHRLPITTARLYVDLSLFQAYCKLLLEHLTI